MDENGEDSDPEFDVEEFNTDFDRHFHHNISLYEEEIPMEIDRQDSEDTNWIDDQRDVRSDWWLPPFTSTPGPKVAVPDSPIDTFGLYCPDWFLNEIVDCSNQFIQQMRPNVKPIDLTELKKFIGIQLLMGVKRVSVERDHWAKDPLVGTPEIKSALSRNRYMAIKQIIRFYDITTTETNDSLIKVRKLIDHLPNVSKELFQISKEVSIDESLVAFKGRYKDLQYIPSKSAKYGIKFYAVCEPTTGYLIDWRCFADTKDIKTNYSETIVLRLSESAGLQPGQIIFTDRFYTSSGLANELMAQNIGFCGTLQTNRRDSPLDFKKGNNPLNKTNKGPLYKRKGELCCVSWFDKKIVTALSNCFGKGEVTVSRRGKNFTGGTGEIDIPGILEEYIKFMGGVDHFDQKLHYEAYPHRSSMWPQVIWHLFKNVILNNGYTLFKSAYPTSRMTSRQFRLKIARSLIGHSNIVIFTSELSLNCATRGATLIKIPKQKDCEMCKSRGIRKQVTRQCSVCDIPFCNTSNTLEPTCFQAHAKAQIHY
jgi:hypothetical protein